MPDVEVKDNSNVIHQINVDTLGDGSQTQAVKLQMGDEGVDGGYVSSNNPLYVALDFLVRGMMKRLGKLTYDASGQLRIGGSVGISSGTITTLSTMTTGNICYGDAGKAATNIIVTRRPTVYNLVRS